MTLELGVDAGRQMMLNEISEEADEIVAAAFLSHDGSSVQVPGFGPQSTLTQNPKT